MNARRIEITLSQERWEQLEEARGHEPRASFIKRALESALGGAEEPKHMPSGRSVPASVRAPVIPEDVDAYSAGETPSRADRFRNARPKP